MSRCYQWTPDLGDIALYGVDMLWTVKRIITDWEAELDKTAAGKVGGRILFYQKAVIYLKYWISHTSGSVCFFLNPRQFLQNHARACRVSEFRKPKAHEFFGSRQPATQRRALSDLCLVNLYKSLEEQSGRIGIVGVKGRNFPWARNPAF